ncbi:MAG TPA: DUF192 domain-containing protein [Candidatus Paceibacterota bacterium]|nr:DUF192 domain-containing protein [Candidatus Paceibacterota bacterium]
MLRKFLTSLGIIVVCGLVAFLFFLYYMHETSQAPLTSLPDFAGYKAMRIEVDGQVVNVAVADTPPLQELGLGNRSGLGTNEGMLFIFPTDQEESFWMKDMHFSLDMVWISANGYIVYMVQDVSPDTYPENFTPITPARYVLEVPAGYASEHGWKVGDLVVF